MRNVGRSSAAVLVAAVLYGLLPGLVTAATPPPIGSPTDHFAGRTTIGQEGILAMPSASSGGDGLDLQRLQLKAGGVFGDPGDFLPLAEEGAISGPDADKPHDFIAADLDTFTGPDGNPRGSLEPGAAFAGYGLTSSGCPNENDFCLTWSRPKYVGEEHKFDAFGESFGVQFPGSSGPDPRTEISMATGIFDPQEGPSIVLAWVHTEQTPEGIDPRVQFAHVVADRLPSGEVYGLHLGGPIRTLGGGVYNNSVTPGFPERDLTSPSLAVGDFTKAGVDQVAVTWTPVWSGPPQVEAALLGDGSGAGLEVVIAPKTFTMSVAPDYQGFSSFDLRRIGPGVVAVHDARGTGPGFDRLVIAAGTRGVDNLLSLKPVPGSPGTLEASQIETGATACPPGFCTPDTPYGVPQNRTFSSQLDSLGDLDGDGLDEIASTALTAINSQSSLAIYDLSCADELCGSYEIKNPTTWNVQSIETAVVNARETKDQVIAPVPGGTSTREMPQIAVAIPQNIGNQWRPAVQLIGLDGFNQRILSDRTTGFNTYPLGGYTDGQPDIPQLASFPLDGRAQLGDPVQSQYTQLEPSVVLNAPPTHFDILDGQAYDPSFCYAGNQYAVPPACFFNSQYEREQSAATEVVNESTEDWAVSAKLNVETNILDIVDVEAELRGGYGENFKNVGGTTTTDTVNVTVKALNTDKIYAIKRAYDTLEYPLYQPGEENPSGYVLAETPHTVQKRWVDSSSPDAVDLKSNHQPGNILSYPEDRTEAENPFISPTFDENGNPVGPSAFAGDEFELSDSSDYKYELTSQRLQDDSAAVQKQWNVGATVGVGGKIAGIVDTKLEVAGDYKNSKLTTTKTTVGDTTKLTSSMAGVDESFGQTAYTVKPFAYWTANATLVLDYAVEPGVAPPGAPKTWWQLKYGSKPDLTLNLPRLLDFEKQAGISSDAARFISPGISVLQGKCDEGPAPLLNGYPSPGRPLCLRAEVENYSLKDQTGSTDVKFYDADPDVGGELLGTAPASPVPARGNAEAELTWTPDARYAGSRPRIFAVVDASDQVAEIHENNNKGFRDYQARADVTIAPRAPADVLAEPGPGRSLDVEWNDNLDEVQPAGHEWRVAAYPDKGGAPIELTVPGGQSSANLSGLQPGRYRVAVFSTAGGESSPASHPSEPADIVTDEPSAPRNVVGVPRNASVQLSWDPPQDTGGGPVQTYRISEYRVPGESFPEAPVETTVDGGVTALTLSGLTNGRPYRFTLQAVNDRGPGAVSGPSAAVTPLDVPDRPSNVGAQRGAGGVATVTWDPPNPDESRAAVTGYEVTASPGGSVRTVPAGTEAVEFDSLQVGTSYTFRVRANSEVGFGAESQPSPPLAIADPPSAPRNLVAGPGSSPGSAALEWEQPDEDGGVPIASYEACLVGGGCQRIGASRTDASFPNVASKTPLTFEVTARNEAGLDSPVATTTRPVILDEPPTVDFTKVPDEGSFTGPNVVVEFEASPGEATTQCLIDGQGRPCRSPLRLSSLPDGSHTIQVEAASSGGKVTTPMVAWSVDSVSPQASSRKLRKLIRTNDPAFTYRGSDKGGSKLQGYELRTRRAGKRGKFKVDPVGFDKTGKSQSSSRLKVPAGETVCASARAVDGAGNRSEWSEERCTTRPYDESSLRREGKWKKVRGKKLSNNHALDAKSKGAALTFLLGKTSKVKVLAGRCRKCGKLAVEVRGHRRKVIDLSKTKKRKSRIVGFNARWPKKKDGRLRLISLGGGPVRVDGVAVWRTSR